MAVLKRGILGGFTGSVANVVGSSWKGIDVMRSKPLSVANPRTAPQVTQRNKFANVVEVASRLLVPVVKPLWDRFAQRQSGYNAFVSYNIDFFNQAGLVNFSQFQIGRGILTTADIDGAGTAAGTGRAAVDWVNNSGQGTALDSDEVYFVAYNEVSGEWISSSAVVTRSAISAEAFFQDVVNIGDTIHFYLAFRRADGTIVSNTTYSSAPAA